MEQFNISDIKTKTVVDMKLIYKVICEKILGKYSAFKS